MSGSPARVYIPPMKTNAILLTLAAGATLSVSAATAPTDDPFIWLEQAHSERAMQWVEAENAKTSAALESIPLFSTLFNDARVIAEAKDRIPQPNVIGGRVFNFWQDADHEHGIWRQASAPDF
jgi:prolyl oligopeptidase